MGYRSFVTVVLLAVVLCGASWARADLIVGTDVEGNGGYGVGFSFDSDANLVIGQEFSLSASIVADSITLYLNGDGTDNPQGAFTLQLMNLIGPTATNANVLATEVGTFPAGALPTGHAPVTFSGLGLLLNAGDYYLVVSSAAGPGVGWGTNADILPSAIGTVGSSYVGIAFGGALADYTYFDPDNPGEGHANFRIDSVPEPSSLLLAALGLCALAARGWRRRTAR